MDAFHFRGLLGPTFDVKITNYKAKLNKLDFLGKFVNLIHYFSGKQGLEFQYSMANSQM